MDFSIVYGPFFNNSAHPKHFEESSQVKYDLRLERKYHECLNKLEEHQSQAKCGELS